MMTGYQGVESEAQFELVIKQYGWTLKDLEDPYAIYVINANGTSKQNSVMVHGIRTFPFSK